MATTNLSAFQIAGGVTNTTNIAVTGSSQQLTLPSISNQGATGVFTNIGTQTVFIAYNSVTASVSTCMPLLANTSRTLSIPPGVSQISVIAGTTGSTLYVTVGDGV